MNAGPAHFRDAERLLDELRRTEVGTARHAALLGEAHVHATLALAAATAANIRRNGAVEYQGDGGWTAVLAGKVPS